MPKPKAQKPIRILFVGNSFTQRNDLPLLIEQMAASVPVPKIIESESIIANGASLRQHWNKGEALAAIQQGTWDYVVLQEQSTLPIKNAQRFHENVRLFDDEIKKNGAKTALYLTWARQNAPETQAALNAATSFIATQTNATVVPVGRAWQMALLKDPTLGLYDADGSHPSRLGSYLAACVFTTLFLRQSPVDFSIPDTITIGQEQADTIQTAALQSAAWQIASLARA